ncbi:MAG: SPOR domain-containing protein [Treponema sp.]|jgi:tetratricopeptide (TPR) repeat protein|nr:SPOR domain-containing protein [Treponema sp.]
MELTKNRRRAAALAALLFLAGGSVLQAQEPGQLGAEIQRLEQKLSSGIPPAERHDALTHLAQLRQLSGNLASAAAHWLDAAAADPRDDGALVAGAYCLAAIGEWEKAASILSPLLAAGKWGPSMLQAYYLDACLKAWTANDASQLSALGERLEFAALRPMIYYTLWQIISRNPNTAGAGGADSWKTRLLAEFPQSPEARAAVPASNRDSLAVSAVQSPLWLLIPGIAASARPTETAKPAVPVPISAPPADAGKPSTPVSTVVLQTGVFSKEANASAQSDALRKAGYTPSITRKLVNGAELWAVTVPPGQDVNKTIAELKKAGFESFPVK